MGGLVFVVAEAEFAPEVGYLLEFVEEFVEAEVGDDEFAVFEGGSKGIAADFDEAVEVGGAGIYVAHIELDPVLGKVSHRGPARGAAAFDVEGGQGFHERRADELGKLSPGLGRRSTAKVGREGKSKRGLSGGARWAILKVCPHSP